MGQGFIDGCRSVHPNPEYRWEAKLGHSFLRVVAQVWVLQWCGCDYGAMGHLGALALSWGSR